MIGAGADRIEEQRHCGAGGEVVLRNFGQRQSIRLCRCLNTEREEVANMPNKDGKGPKGRGPRDGHGGGKGKGTSKPAGAKKGGKKGGC
jgi:hypothetical protein